METESLLDPVTAVARLLRVKRPKWLRDVADLISHQEDVLRGLRWRIEALSNENAKLKSDLHRIDITNQYLDAKLADIRIILSRSITVPVPARSTSEALAAIAADRM